VWQGVNPLTNSVASPMWVVRPAAHPATLFFEIDGEALPSLQARDAESPRTRRAQTA